MNAASPVHGTCVALGDAGALLRGPSGAGKSDLALRFLAAYGHQGAALVADDRVCLRADGGRLLASAPDAIAGRLEARGVGILSVPHRGLTELRLLVDLVAPDRVPRLPEAPPPTEALLGIALARVVLAPFEASAAVKLKLLLAGGS